MYHLPVPPRVAVPQADIGRQMLPAVHRVSLPTLPMAHIVEHAAAGRITFLVTQVFGQLGPKRARSISAFFSCF